LYSSLVAKAMLFLAPKVTMKNNKSPMVIKEKKMDGTGCKICGQIE
jgi:hypothetical protein